MVDVKTWEETFIVVLFEVSLMVAILVDTQPTKERLLLPRQSNETSYYWVMTNMHASLARFH